MKDYIISIVVCSITSAVMIIIGLCQLKSKKPVGFWSGDTPPLPEEITDVGEYNKKHGRMWILYGAAIFISSVVGISIDNPWILVGMYFIVIAGGVGVMIFYHYKLEKIYRIKGENYDDR